MGKITQPRTISKQKSQNDVFLLLYLCDVTTICILISTASHYGDPWGFHAIKTLTMTSDNVTDQFSLKLFKCIIYICCDRT